jgi:hypothetical protein
MATQRVTPVHEDTSSNQNISITSSFQANPAGCIIQSSQTLTFTNSSGSPVAINFIPNPIDPNQQIFNNIPTLPGTGVPSLAQTPNASNGSVNYNVVAAGVTYGPFSIQVGTGPLQVLISMSGGVITATPNPAAIPPYSSVLGIAVTVAMYPDDPNNDYSIAWKASDPLTPALTSPDGLPHGDSNTTIVNDYKYTITSPKNPKLGGSGGGTVRIKGS